MSTQPLETLEQTGTPARAQAWSRSLESALFCGLLFLSGFCGISYEVLFGRVLGNLIGDQMTVSASILMTFLLGIGIGTRYAYRLWRFLWLIELGIGLCGVAFAFGTGVIDTLLYAEIPLLGRGLAASVTMCVVLLCVPSMLIGCSLPLFAGYMSRLRAGQSFAVAYGVYNMGAALTALVIEFWLVRTFGLRGALVSIAALNLVVAIVLVTRFARLRHEAPARKLVRSTPWRDKWAVASVSVASAAFQLMMIKVSECLIGPFHETFALVLAIVLMGIALGSALVGVLRLSFQTVLVLGLIGLAWFLGGFGIVAELYAQLYPTAAESYLYLIVLKFSAICLLMGLPSLAFGATIPALLDEKNDVARESGELLFVSSVANAFGFLLMAFVLHRAFDYGMVVLLISACTAAGLLIRNGLQASALAATVASLVAACGLHGKVWDEDLLYLGHTAFHSSEDLEETRAGLRLPQKFKGYQDVFAITEMDGRPYFFINGYMSIPLDSPSEKIVGAFSSIFAPALDKALVLGVGSGATAATVGQMFESTDAVEINPAVLDNLHRMSEYNFDIEHNPHVNIVQDDAIHFVKSKRERYSLIINTVTTPLYFSSSKLYTDDFLKSIEPRLTPGGVYVTWVDSRVGDRGLDIVLQTVAQTFDHCALGCVKSSYFLLLCSNEPIRARHPRVVAENAVLNRYFGELEFNPEWFAYGLLTGRADALADARATPANTLDYPALEFEMSRLRKRGIARFKRRLRNGMSLAGHRQALGESFDWRAEELLLHTDELLGDSTITDRWKALIRREHPDVYRRAADSQLAMYARRAETEKTADAYHKYGYRLLRLEEYQAAIDQFELALSVDARRDNSHFNLGACYERLGNHDKALEHYRLEATVDPGDEDVPYRIGRIALAMERYQQALTALDRAVAITDDSENHQLRGDALAALGRIEEARLAYRRSLSLDPQNVDVRRALARIENQHAAAN